MSLLIISFNIQILRSEANHPSICRCLWFSNMGCATLIGQGKLDSFVLMKNTNLIVPKFSPTQINVIIAETQ